MEHYTWTCPQCEQQFSGATAGERCPTDASFLIPEETRRKNPNDYLLGRLFAGRYALIDILGVGGVGAVYEALDTQGGNFVALKIMLPSVGDGEGNLRGRFLREARILSGFNSPGIVRVFDFGEEDGVLFMVLELLPGRSLEKLMAEYAPCPLKIAVDLLRQILRALEEPHAVGLVHRDLKPANIMVQERRGRRSIKIIDFGIAKARYRLDDLKTRVGLALGTPMYMAPEQFQWEGLIGPWSDQYAIGVLLYELMSGRLPFQGSMPEIAAGHLKEAPPPIEGISPRVWRVIQIAMNKRAEERFEDVTAMRLALEALLEPEHLQSQSPQQINPRSSLSPRGATRVSSVEESQPKESSWSNPPPQGRSSTRVSSDLPMEKTHVSLAPRLLPSSQAEPERKQRLEPRSGAPQEFWREEDLKTQLSLPPNPILPETLELSQIPEDSLPPELRLPPTRALNLKEKDDFFESAPTRALPQVQLRSRPGAEPSQLNVEPPEPPPQRPQLPKRVHQRPPPIPPTAEQPQAPPRQRPRRLHRGGQPLLKLPQRRSLFWPTLLLSLLLAGLTVAVVITYRRHSKRQSSMVINSKPHLIKAQPDSIEQELAMETDRALDNCECDLASRLIANMDEEQAKPFQERWKRCRPVTLQRDCQHRD